MPRTASPLPLVGGTLALLLFMGSAQAALFRLANQPARPRTVAEHQVLHCDDAVRLFDEGRPQEALILLRGQASQPMPITRETPIPINFTPAAQVLRLAQQMCRAAEKAGKAGHPGRARVYLAQCYLLGKRIRTTTQPDQGLSLLVARLVERAAQRTETALENPMPTAETKSTLRAQLRSTSL